MTHAATELAMLAQVAAANTAPQVNLWLPTVCEDLTIGELVSMYARDVADRCSSANTRRTVLSQARAVLRLELDGKALAGLPASRLTRLMCQRLVLEGRAAARTINGRVRLLGAAYRWASLSGLIADKDPTKGVRYAREPAAGRALSDQAIRAFVHVLDVAEGLGLDLEWLDFARILLAVGLRVGDLRRLRALDVDQVSRHLMTVQKGDRPVTLPYPRAAAPFFARRVSEAQGEYLFPGYHNKTSRRLDRYVGENKPCEYWRGKILPIAADLEGARTRAGLTVEDLAAKIGKTAQEILDWERAAIETHDLQGRRITLAYMRSTNVTAKVRAGVSVKLAGASVGHQSERSTRHYVGPLFESLHEASAPMDQYFQDKKRQTSSNSAKRAAANVRRLRAARGWTQAELARRAKKATRTIQAWEVELRDLQAVDRLAKVFDCDPSEILA